MPSRWPPGSSSEFDIRTPSIGTAVGTLSGGNQQKVIVAREISRDVKLAIASQPTRGVDVGSIEYIHERIVGLRDAGVAVLVVSTELDEVMALADRVLVMFGGRIVADLDRADDEPQRGRPVHGRRTRNGDGRRATMADEP